ncbi:MATH domain-containing protein [Caenorhabditis elegans]|uniref:MATH domain-containing protein n=1 Tax=Caenorhabditis elegans TaxID=6239 RepID=O17192_CAEEL|nr:MATH domain-containing protein [Caenorhabditis elegans]CCD64682.2 MATH domain-containing protein [Caenorhabditis elegans]|eukprot:NP_494118.3 MATH (meprin-associated Traf homology) domain containing [Caenorhabditis elegans]
MSCKPFLLIHTFKDISKLGEGESYFSDKEERYNIPWRLQIFRKGGFLGLNLKCEKKECFGERKWSFQTKFTMKLVAVSGKFFQRAVQHEFQQPKGHGMDKFISWENMLRDYVNNDSIIIEIHADMVSSTDLPNSQPDSNNSFVLKHTFKKISRFIEGERDCSDAEEHFTKDIFGACQTRRERYNFIRWNDMEKDYVTNDSIDVEIRVKIINITDAPCNIANTEKTFVLSHTVKNMSSIKEGGNYFTNIQTRFNIPWKLQIRKQKGFFGLYLLCEKQLCESRKWSIETESQLKIVSPNGRSLLFGGTDMFEKPFGYGWTKLMRWDNLEEKYIVDDALVIEAHVKILNMIGIEDETPVEKPTGIVIPVGDQEYSMEKWLEMAFDH